MNTSLIKRGLTLACAIFAIVVLVAVVSVVGIVAGGLYNTAPKLVQASRGGDLANLVVGLPVLTGSIWLARRGSLIGLLAWPGALFYVVYIYALYAVGDILKASVTESPRGRQRNTG